MALLLWNGWSFCHPYRTPKDNAFHLFWLRLSEAKPRQVLGGENCGFFWLSQYLWPARSFVSAS
jgi:hypothetical protein